MAATFDRRVVPAEVLALLQACARRAPYRLAGGAALSGVYLHHRLSADVDLFVHDRVAHRDLVSVLAEAAGETGFVSRIVRDAGSFVRAHVEGHGQELEVDLVHDTVPEIEPTATPIEGVSVASLTDLRVNKLTCILSRSEPRDLVDLLFLDQAGFPPDHDLLLATRKDAGIDPGVLAWLLSEFPVDPLPAMLLPLTSDQLRQFRNDLRDRFRHLALPSTERG